jgi:hypothetical protein
MSLARSRAIRISIAIFGPLLLGPKFNNGTGCIVIEPLSGFCIQFIGWGILGAQRLTQRRQANIFRLGGVALFWPAQTGHTAFPRIFESD